MGVVVANLDRPVVIISAVVRPLSIPAAFAVGLDLGNVAVSNLPRLDATTSAAARNRSMCVECAAGSADSTVAVEGRLTSGVDVVFLLPQARATTNAGVLSSLIAVGSAAALVQAHVAVICLSTSPAVTCSATALK